MANSQYIGNGIGMLYVVDPTGTTIVGTQPNTPKGVRDIRAIGSVCAPISAVRSAVGSITFTATPAGNVTAVTIGGVNQIGANVAMVAGNPTLSAVAVAAAINAFTPATGDDFTASSIGAVVYIFSTPSGGSAANGLSITVSVSTVSITSTTVDFSSGSNQTGDFDSVIGLRFYFDERGNASRTSFASATEITKYIVSRGLQVGIITKSLAVNGDKLTGIDRSCAITNIYVDTQSSAATDELSFIETVDFVEGDVIRLSQFVAGRVVIVTDNTVSLGAGNIYLTDQTPFNCEDNKSIELRLQFATGLGLIWVENGRSISGGAVQLSRVEMRQLIANGTVVQGQSYFITDVGQAGIIVSGIDSNSITSRGDYVGYFPDYQNVSGDYQGVWSSILSSVTTGDVYSYGGNAYKSLTGAVGTAPDTDTTNWELQAITTNYYTKEILSVQYEIAANVITQGSDGRGNLVLGSSAFPLFKWGCDTCSNNTIVGGSVSVFNIDGDFKYNLFKNVIFSPSGLNFAFVDNIVTNTLFVVSPIDGVNFTSNQHYGDASIPCTYTIANGAAATSVTMQSNNTYCASALTLTFNASETFQRNVINSGSIGISLGGFLCQSNYISINAGPVQFTLVEAMVNEVINNYGSTYKKLIDLDANMSGTTLTLPSGYEYVGTLITTSAGVKVISKIIASGAAVNAKYPITVQPANTVSTTVTPIAIALSVTNNIVGTAATPITLVGRTNGADFYTILRNGDLWSTVNSKVHA